MNVIVKIRFIELRAPDLTVFDPSLLPRLGLPLLGRVLADTGHDVRIYTETLAPIDSRQPNSAKAFFSSSHLIPLRELR